MTVSSVFSHTKSSKPLNLQNMIFVQPMCSTPFSSITLDRVPTSSSSAITNRSFRYTSLSQLPDSFHHPHPNHPIKAYFTTKFFVNGFIIRHVHLHSFFHSEFKTDLFLKLFPCFSLSRAASWIDSRLAHRFLFSIYR